MDVVMSGLLCQIEYVTCCMYVNTLFRKSQEKQYRPLDATILLSKNRIEYQVPNGPK